MGVGTTQEKIYEKFQTTAQGSRSKRFISYFNTQELKNWYHLEKKKKPKESIFL